MADNKKIYTIQINGIQESTNAVEALNKQLDNLEKRINTLQAKSVNINTSGGGSTRTSNASAMSEEEKLAKQYIPCGGESLGEAPALKVAGTKFA